MNGQNSQPSHLAQLTYPEDGNANFNMSRKPEISLNKILIKEMINLYGIRCLYLNSERIAEDLVFQDFAGMEVKKEFTPITLLPEEKENYEGEDSFNSFGFYNQSYTTLYISEDDVLGLFPDAEKAGHVRARMINSLLVLPSSVILEITDFEAYTPGINNMWAFGDMASAYKLTCKVFSHNGADEGTDFDTQINLDEGPENSRDSGKIFEHTEEVSTNIDNFFDGLLDNEEEIEKENTPNAPKDLTRVTNTDNPFGDLG